MKYLIVLALLAGCTNVTPGQTITDACAAADSALKVAITADKAGKMSTQQEQVVTMAGTVVNGICSAKTPPANTQAALAALVAATGQLASVVK